MLELAKLNSINPLETDYPVLTLHTRSVSHSDYTHTHTLSLSLSLYSNKKKQHKRYLFIGKCTFY